MATSRANAGTLLAGRVSLSKTGLSKLLLQNASALQKYRSGLANRHYAPCDIIMGPGDSVVEGQGATVMDRRFIARFRANQRARYPVAGVTGGRGFIGSDKTGVSSYTWPVTTGGAVTQDDNYGLKRRAAVLSAAGHSRTFPLQGTSVDLMYAHSTSSGIISYTVDGGSATTFNLGTASGVTASLIGGKALRITLGSSGAHTLVVSYSSGGSSTIEGVIEYDGDEAAGIRVHDGGHHGYSTANWVNRLGFNYWMNAYKTIDPALIIMEVGTNDLTNSVNATSTLANWQTLLSTIRGTGADPSVLLLAMPKRSDATQSDYDAYVAAAYSLTASDSKVALLDLSKRMPYVGLSGNLSMGLYGDTVHPTDKGHSMMADLVADALAMA